MTSKKLEVIVDPDKPTIVTRRVVAAPRALVFDAFTKPEHVKRWIGPAVLTWVACDYDLRVGGAWRWRQRSPEGMEFGFHGVFKGIVPPEKIVWTFTFDLFPDVEALETLTLEEQDGKTTIHTLSVHKTMAARDGHVAGGRMEAGMAEGYERLDEMLASQQAR